MPPVYSHTEVPASPFQFDFRSNLCINILTVTNQSFWYLLARGHHRNIPSCFISLPEIPVPTVGSACATLGHVIYVLGGSRNGYPTNTVQIFNPRQGTWREGQRMGVPREFAYAGMIGGRMYIVGGSPYFPCCAEAFDPMTLQRSPVPSTSVIPGWTVAQSLFLDGRFLETDAGGLLFAGEDGRLRNRDFWSFVKMAMGKITLLDGVLYTCRLGGYITGYEQATNYSFVVQGFDWRREFLPNLWVCSRMINLRGMLCIVWENNQMINCIGILVNRTRNEMVTGFIAWRERAPLPTEAVNGELEHCVQLEF